MDRIVYIDESGKSTREFQRKAHGKLEVSAIKPVPNLHECVVEIIELQPEAVITDFNLKLEDPSIPYSGADLIDEFLEIRAGFPCFILTAFEDAATTNSEDVNLVYPRSFLSSKTAEVSFFDKVSTQISHYKKRQDHYVAEYDELLELSKKRELNADEEEKLIELDTMLEHAANARSAKPKHLKDGEAFAKWGNLLSEADALIARLRTAR